MATSKTVRAWAATNYDAEGKPYALLPSRGKLSHAAKAAFNEEHPDDPYTGEIDNLNPDKKVTVKTFREGTSKTGKAYKVPVSKTVKVADARNWLRENGHNVGERGRLSAELLKTYAVSA